MPFPRTLWAPSMIMRPKPSVVFNEKIRSNLIGLYFTSVINTFFILTSLFALYLSNSEDEKIWNRKKAVSKPGNQTRARFGTLKELRTHDVVEEDGELVELLEGDLLEVLLVPEEDEGQVRVLGELLDDGGDVQMAAASHHGVVDLEEDEKKRFEIGGRGRFPV